MNYSSLVFRKDMSGVFDYIRWVGITSDLMRACLYPQREFIDGVSHIWYDGELIPEEKAIIAFNKFFSIYHKYLERGYDIARIGEHDGIFSLGCFEEDYRNCQFTSSDFSSGVCNQPKEKFSSSDGTIVIERYENGAIVRDLKSNSSYYYSNKDVDFLLTFRDFPLEMHIVAQINLGLLKRKEKFDIIDGLGTNRLPCNLIKVQSYQSMLNHFSRGYVIGKQGFPTGRCKFMPEFWYKGRCYVGRLCDNEPEAVCEAYKLEQEIAGTDRDYLFNPINFHRNHQNLVEKYVKGEITEFGLQRDILTDVATNPFLILRYNLIDLCRKYCIYISPFKLDAEGFMVDLNGTRYSYLAEQYIKGVSNNA